MNCHDSNKLNIEVRDRGFERVAIKINVACETCIKELKIRFLNIHLV